MCHGIVCVCHGSVYACHNSNGSVSMRVMGVSVRAITAMGVSMRVMGVSVRAITAMGVSVRVIIARCAPSYQTVSD